MGKKSKAKKQVKKYYKEKESDIKQKASTDTKRLQEDLTKIFADSGIAMNRATEDYIRNVGNIESNKSLDVADLADYITTNTGRTQEDLDTSLAKELRRFTLESDQINESLADKGRTFSERKDEKIAQEGNAQQVSDIEMTAGRSFADIRRYEVAKNAEIQNKYGQQTEVAETTKTRSLEDILTERQDKEERIKRGEEDVAFGKAIDLRENAYSKNDALSNIDNFYDAQNNSLKNTELKVSVSGA